jgi:hypothetical protein
MSEHDLALPHRPRRRLLTPVTLGLAAVAIAALGFTGGVLVQKREQGSGSGTGALAAARTAFAQRGGGAAGGGAAPVTGTVASVDGTTIYVKDADGTTVKVRTNGNSKVTRTAKSGIRKVHPGDTVVVVGSTRANGTVTASQLTATASGATTLGGFGFGGFGGAGGGTGGSPPGGG